MFGSGSRAGANGAARRLVLSVAGMATAVLLVGGCSSSTSGSGGKGGFPGTSSGAPSVSSTSGGGGGGGGPISGGDFCTEWASASPTSGLSGGQVRSNFVAHWDKLAAIAPDEIKSDVQTIDAYLHSVLGGQPDPSKASGVANAVSSVVQWVAAHCH